MSTTATPAKPTRAAMRALVKNTANLDAPTPPRPAPPVFAPSWGRDRTHNPQNFSFQNVVPDLSALDGIFPEDKQHKIRFLSWLEVFICSTQCSASRRKLRLPCDQPGQCVALVRSNRMESVSVPNNTEMTYLTIADYPAAWLDETSRDKWFSDFFLTQNGL